MAELPSAATSKVLPTEATSKVIPADLRRRLRAESWQRAKQMRLLYLLFLLPLAIFVLFHYLPMYGNIIAFKDFRLGRGFWGSPWVGLQHFEDFSATRTRGGSSATPWSSADSSCCGASRRRSCWRCWSTS